MPIIPTNYLQSDLLVNLQMWMSVVNLMTVPFMLTVSMSQEVTPVSVRLDFR